ncbi:glycosyltransferase family 4 protein [[Clostridium] innocuum]|nr:glycosyltransferase family 4 protein [[Clostridium] innocuum]
MCENNHLEKRVWIISYFAGGPSYCPRVPDYSLALYLQKHEYDVTIFASSALHNSNKNFIQDKSLCKLDIVDNVPFVFIKTRNYKGMKGESLSFIDFYRNLLKVEKNIKKPDLIIAAMPQPLSCLAGIKLARKYRVPYITSIVDLWPLSIVAYANFSKYNPAIIALYQFEKWVYKKSKELVFTWEGAYDYIIDMKWDNFIPREKFHYINIGVDLNSFYKNMKQFKVKDDDLEDETFKVMYCGSVRTANDIDTVVSCAKLLNDEGYSDKIKFIIYGDGPDKELLIKRCINENINNVIFKGQINKKYIPYVLSKSNLNILNLKQASTQKYGNSSNKLFEYFASGNPVIANIDEGNYPIISKYKCGRVVKPASITDYVEGIKYFYKLSEDEMNLYKKNALNTVKLYDTEYLNSEWEKLISNCLQ